MRDGKPHEECGVFGVRMKADEAAGVTYNALLALQHRGQEGAGIAVLRDNSILYHKDVGLVSEVFSAAELEKMPRAQAAVGHVRYSTTGANSRDNVQPMVVEYLRGRLAAVHNGNIVNAPAIRKKLQDAGCNFAAQSDSEVIAALIADEAAIGMVNSKTTAVRVIPAIGKRDGETLEFGGLLGSGPVMKISRFSPAKFIQRGGQIPAPMQSLKN